MFNLKRVIAIIAVFAGFVANAQNKIPNAGFETYSSLPNNYGQLSRATGWINPMGLTGGSPDYFNTFNNAFNIADKVPPKNGTGYAGTYLEHRSADINADDYKEYMTIQLSSTLEAGATYTLSFYTAHLYGNPPVNFNQPAGITFHDLPDSEKGYFGAVFSTAAPVLANTVGNTSPKWTSIKNDFGVGRVLVSNTNTEVYGESSRNAWVKVTLQYTAIGTEQYITIGQFRPGGTTLANDMNGVYYVYDDFSLTVPTVLTKSVAPSSITDGGTAKYTFTLTNTAVGNTAQAGLSFTDNLPSGLRIAATPNVVVTGLTGGTVTAAGGGTSIVVSGYNQVAGGVATITVDVTNVPGQTNAACGSNPAAFTNSSLNISNTSTNITNSVGNVCIIITPVICAPNSGVIIRSVNG